jgi:large subunit ribosomal protein L21
MFAIVNIKGVQYKVQEKQRLYVPKLKEKEGDKITFKDVLLYSPDDSTMEIGKPYLEHSVDATVLNTLKDDKVIVFKKKRRKGYRVKKGHKQNYTQISIDKIT